MKMLTEQEQKLLREQMEKALKELPEEAIQRMSKEVKDTSNNWIYKNLYSIVQNADTTSKRGIIRKIKSLMKNIGYVHD